MPVVVAVEMATIAIHMQEGWVEVEQEEQT
jgi:hypothetical protein